MDRQNNHNLMIGLAGSVTAYFIWGLQPIYWKTLDEFNAWTVIAHRYCWTAVFLLLFLYLSGQANILRETLNSLRGQLFKLSLLVVVSVVAVLNWWINIFAPMAGHVVELGIGLFLTPIMSVILGVVFYRERLNFVQKVSVLLALVGIGIMLVRFGGFPWIALGVSSTWAIYGAVKKKLYLNPSVSILLETIFVVPFAAAFLMLNDDVSSFVGMLDDNGMLALALIGTGILTSVPLITYTYATNYLPLNMLGFSQYLSPMLTLCLGVFVYKEPFRMNELVPLVFIWSSIAVFVVDQIRVRIASNHKKGV